ncbi:MAG: electron transporter RnfC, partial [Candidatus Omnitrophota bacterium]|nr:electron transporter RnfC [Candidatus Omnitrophota bacterium]
MIKIDKHVNAAGRKAIEKMPLPQRVYIPLIQHLGKPCLAEVAVGDTVQTGQRIGGAQAHVYAPVHASISGKVSAIKDWPHPVLGRCPAVV